jgi:hypothetical protein
MQHALTRSRPVICDRYNIACRRVVLVSIICSCTLILHTTLFACSLFTYCLLVHPSLHPAKCEENNHALLRPHAHSLESCRAAHSGQHLQGCECNGLFGINAVFGAMARLMQNEVCKKRCRGVARLMSPAISHVRAKIPAIAAPNSILQSRVKINL